MNHITTFDVSMMMLFLLYHAAEIDADDDVDAFLLFITHVSSFLRHEWSLR